jgi:hypothetical protein
MDHPELGRVLYNAVPMSENPDDQVEQTIAAMCSAASEDCQHPAVQQDVAQAWASDDPTEDTWNYLSRAIASGMTFVRDEQTGVPFERDKFGRWNGSVVEVLIRPADQCCMPERRGDCDDFAMLGAAHLLARGVPCSYATVAASAEDPSIYSHVYLVAYPKTGPRAGQRVPMDLSHGKALGWEAPNEFGKFREWPVTSGGVCWLWLAIAAGAAWLAYRWVSGGGVL